MQPSVALFSIDLFFFDPLALVLCNWVVGAVAERLWFSAS
jgi:hypothetical protein